MRKLHEALKRLEWRVLERFNRWFTSEGGVYQTFLITLTIVGIEQAFPSLDQHGFWLLYYLTVYSAVTQPALAYAGRQNAVEVEGRESAFEERLERVERMLEELCSRSS